MFIIFSKISPMFGIILIIYAIVLQANSVVILNEKRFLNRIGLPLSSEHRHKLGPTAGKIVDFINSIRTVFEIPLIFTNVFFLIYELLFG